MPFKDFVASSVIIYGDGGVDVGNLHAVIGYPLTKAVATREFNIMVSKARDVESSNANVK